VRICLIASSRFPIAEPFAGGLEAWTHAFASELAARGHDITLFAAPGSDPGLPLTVLPVQVFEPSAGARADVHAPPAAWMTEHHAYLGLMLGLARGDGGLDGGLDGGFDVVHNTSLHHLPVAMASSLTAPMVTTLHTPPVPWLESAVALSDGAGTFVAVSEVTARAWAPVVPTAVVRNGVDTRLFAVGPGGGPAVWTGRMVPEKAPHHAIEAARLAGVELVLAGPESDPRYVSAEIRPRLGPGVRYAGHLRRRELAELLGSASVALVTPEWDEPYGLVAAEAMSCGTPVAAYARGALTELVVPSVGELAVPGDVGSLATALALARTRDRDAVRAHALQHCSLERMVDDYERLYASLQGRRAA
jgi:glycosyltransferase involved in cell wall biosynthesis